MNGETDMHPPHTSIDSARRRAQPAAGGIAARTRRTRSREGAFTLIEIMAVVLIMGLLASIVGVTVIRQIDKGRVMATRIQIKQLEVALIAFYSDSGFFPSTEQGLEALVEKPSIGREPRDYPEGGYLQGGVVPLDAWQGPYQYQSPGQISRDYDLWSLGADAAAGGTGVDADIGNWPKGAGEG
jgi:general secretion pathway protein G